MVSRLKRTPCSWKYGVGIDLRGFEPFSGSLLLMTNDVRHARHLTNDVSYGRCGGDIENMDHVFRLCPIACQSCLISVIPCFKAPSFYIQVLSSWLLKNLEDESEVDGRCWSLIFAVTLDVLWKCRNVFEFKDAISQRHEIMLRILVLVDAIANSVLWVANFTNIRAPLANRDVVHPELWFHPE
ncbi:Putative ribonuclease H protein [Glycine soja]|nr:Putative ribonuclease H protein [Glycine soja]